MNTLKIPDPASATSTLQKTENEDEDRSSAMGYQQTLMYGRYSKSLGDYAKEEAKRQKILEKKRKRQIQKRNEEITGKHSGSYCFPYQL